MLGLGLEETLLQYLRAVGWSVTAAVGFAFGVGIALKVFDWLSTDIDEWEEIKKGNRILYMVPELFFRSKIFEYIIFN